ncbi:MAG: sigma-70 family RNA polymerase sigma factor [Planctomycetota bacterium]
MSSALHESSDARLVALAREGDRAAFAALVERHAGALFALAVARTRNPADADDLTQEVFLIAWRDLRRLKDAALWQPWLTGILRRHVSRFHRQKTRQSRRLAARAERQLGRGDLPGSVPKAGALDVSPSGGTDVEREEAAAIVQRAVASLPPDLGEPLVLYYFEGQSTEVVAERLGATPAAVRKRLERARQKLRDRLDPKLLSAIAVLRPHKDFTSRVLESLPAQTATMVSIAGLCSLIGGMLVSLKPILITASVIAALIPAWWLLTDELAPASGNEVADSSRDTRDVVDLEASPSRSSERGESTSVPSKVLSSLPKASAREAPRMTASSATVIFRVVQAGTERTLRGVSVEITSQSDPGDRRMMVSGLGGELSLELPRDEVFQATAVSTDSVEIEASDVLELVPGASSSQSLEVTARFRLSGRLVADGSDRPIGITSLISKHEEHGMAALADTDHDGRFRGDRLVSPGLVEVQAWVPNTLMSDPSEYLVVGTVDVGTNETDALELAHPWSGVLVGRVEDELGRPIAGARLAVALALSAYISSDRRISLDQGRIRKSDSEGRFRLEPMPTVPIVVFGAAEGYGGKLSKPLQFENGRAEVVLVLPAATTLRGRVLLHDGRPAVGASVHAYNAPVSAPANVETDEQGRFVFEDIIPETYTVTAHLHPYPASHLRDVEVKADGSSEVEIHFEGSGLAITGRVLSESGEPVRRATVRADRQEGDGFAMDFSDEEGRFELTGLSEGAYALKANDSAFAESELSVHQAGETDVEIRLPTAKVTLKIRVVSAADGAPLGPADAYVSVHGRTSFGWADSEGVSEIQAVPGEYTVTCGASGFAPAMGRMEIGPGDEGERELIVRLDTGSRVSGRVVDSEGRPVEGATVCTVFEHFLIKQTAVQSDESGRFTIHSLPASGARIGIAQPGQYHSSLPVDVVPGEEPTLVVR